ncbi:hypothetical protein BJ878DRAFT_540274 [Calycina marina]|uniref:Uncharacterized protein n=1 Tax=Calycina marina TaxID=1763456 RepID=A0A9P8CIH4_9HELO|nr:hypothetical protein BJ878DRAFT_540274 [Calycina marina]
MPWHQLPQIAFAVATYPFNATQPSDLPLEIGDELYIIEEGGGNEEWYRGYLVAPPSLLAGLTAVQGQVLEARVFSGIFPASCVEIREVLGVDEDIDVEDEEVAVNGNRGNIRVSLEGSPLQQQKKSRISKESDKNPNSQTNTAKSKRKRITNGTSTGNQDGPRGPNAPKPPAPVPMLKIGDETPTSDSEPLVDEIASCLREWHSTNLHELLLSRQYPQLEKLNALVASLDLARKQFLQNVLTTWELDALREKTVWDLVRGNKLLNREVIVRDPVQRGRILTGDDSAVEITKLQSMMTLLDERLQPPTHDALSLHHLLLDVKPFVGGSTESTTLVFFLATKTPASPITPISECYSFEVAATGALTSLANAGNMRTLFRDLSAADIGETQAVDSELYLIVKVRSTQQITAGKPGSRGGSRDGPAPTRYGEKPPSTSGSKSGRRSLMWGSQKSKNPAYSRNAPISSKLNSLAEQSEETIGTRGESRDATPGTSDFSFRGPATNGTERGSFSRVVSKTLGVGAIKLNWMMKQGLEVERIINLWMPAVGFAEEDYKYSDGWEEVVRELIESPSGHYEKARKVDRLQVHLKPFENSDAQALIKETSTLLSGVSKTNKMGFSGAPTNSRHDIYFTLNEVFLPRGALLSRSVGSAAPLASSVACSNLEVTLEVRKANSERLEGAIYSSSNGEGRGSWASTVTQRDEAWNLTLRLAVPPNEVPGCHLVMVLADAPNPPFAICHIPLWDQQAFIRDGHHSLLLYRYDESTSTPRGNCEGKIGYLSLPWNSRGKDDVSKDEALTGPIATLRVQTFLCSTKFSQDKVVLGLLRWKEQAPGDVQELLKRLIFVPEIEVVKLLSDVFDAIFGILVENAGKDDYEDLIFSALVTVLGIVHDRRFNLGPLVDQYVETKFNYPFATPCLVRSFTRLLGHPEEPETSRKLRATFKVVRHILKFITHARGQQIAKEAGIGITSTSPGFSKHIRKIFKELDSLMRNTTPILVGSQTLAAQHFHTWLPELTGLLTTEEILHIAIDFMDSCADVKGKLILYKLVLIINYSHLELFSQPEQKSALCANTVRWIAPHWGSNEEITQQWRDQIRLCASILSTQLDGLGPEVPDHIPKIIDSYLALHAIPKKPQSRLSLLFPTAYPFPTKPVSKPIKFDEVLVELTAILSSISNLPTGMQLDLAEDEMATLLENTLQVHLSIVEAQAFPSDWLSVHIYHHKSTMRTLEYLAGILLESFLPDPDNAEDYNTQLWKTFFTVLLKLVGSDALALETFPEQKRRAVWKIAGDVREHCADLLRRTWEAIGWETNADDKLLYGMTRMGGYQVQYVPSLVGPIVELCLSVHEGLRRVAVEVLQTMIISEFTLSEDLSIIQTEMIDSFDHLFKSKPLTESIQQKLFINELLDLFEPLSSVEGDALYASVWGLLSTVDEFLDLLVAVYSTDMAGEASHMMHRLRLMEFLRDMRKEQIFIRYVHQLAGLQATARNHKEAGLALKLHADMYDWESTTMVPALIEPEFPPQTSFDRKERIYFEMITHFEEGEAWSSALDAYQELQKQYQDNVFDFPKLARTQRAIATIYETIAKSDKIVPKYFRVVYRGMGFPPGLRDKEFIFEGSATERTSAFADRMQEQHPAAQIHSHSGDLEDIEGQFLQVSALTPHRELEHHVFQRARVPVVVRDYLLSAHPQHFSITSKRQTSGPVQEHHAEKLIYTTAESFPTILRCSEIVSVDRVQFNAIRTALERIVRKTQEMGVVEKRVVDGEDNMAPLLMEALSISVDTNSGASIAQYRDLLRLNGNAEDVEDMDLTPLKTALKIALIDHAVMIKRCLGHFAKLPDNIQGVHSESREELQQNFQIAFAPELTSFAFPQAHQDCRSPTPTPSWAIASPVSERMSSPIGIPRSLTNGTILTTDTSLLNTTNTTMQPIGSTSYRLSFMRRTPNPINIPLPETPQTHINGTKNAGRDWKTANGTLKSINRGKSDTSHPDHDGHTRRSYFASPADRGRSEKDEGSWVTSSDLTRSNTRDAGSMKDGRRSSSSQRPEDGVLGVLKKGGSVRKRLSMLKLGKKSSKGNVFVGSVAEE